MIPTYEAIFDESTKGVFGISLVENPATQEYFVKLSQAEKEKIKQRELKFSTIDEEQRILLGLVLEPNVPIYRNDNGEEFNITFNDQTVKSLAHAFISNGYQHNSTIEHNDNEKIEGIAFVESWIVDDSKHDKSNAYGMEYPKGSWLVAMKVNSDEIWNDYIKSGKVKGFSIDAVVKLREVKTKSDIKMSLADKLKKFIGLKEEEKTDKKEVKLGQVNIEDGSVMFEFDGEVMEVGASVFAVDPAEPDNKIPVPVGKYPLEDGSTLVVNEEGVIAEIVPKEPAADETPAPEQNNEAAPVPMAEEADNKIKSILIKYQEETDLKMSAMSTKMEEMQKQIVELQEQLSKVNQEVIQMSEQPVQKPKQPVQSIALNKHGRLLEKLRNVNN